MHLNFKFAEMAAFPLQRINCNHMYYSIFIKPISEIFVRQSFLCILVGQNTGQKLNIDSSAGWLRSTEPYIYPIIIRKFSTEIW